MESKNKHLEDIDTIRSIMERSTRFLSLSGLSGIVAGLIAVAGSIVAIMLILDGNTDGSFPDIKSEGIAQLLFLDALLILTLAVASALILSNRKAVRQGVKMWTPVSKRLLLNLSIPLITGGLFIVILYNNELFGLIIPSMLIFYGLALVSAGKFTFGEIFYMGILEILTGLTAGIFPEYGIFLWIFGFGLLHIAYGLVMYRKYDR